MEFCLASQVAPIKPLDYDRQKALLGKSLFHDTRLSPSGTDSCEKCHNLYWSPSGTSLKNIKISFKQTLNSPTVLNSALNYLFFKDGRVKNIREQVIESIVDINQLGSSEKLVVEKVSLNPHYKHKFKTLYKDGVTFNNIVDAIVNFQKALLTPNSKFDKFISGDNTVLSEDEKKGFELFKKAGCINCHNGVNLGSNVYYDMQLDCNLDQNSTGIAKYKVPGLRNISKTGPYLYDGSERDLKDVIEHIANLRMQNEINKEQIELIYKFLLTLDGDNPEILK
ncbi:cytochrome-c peroxidase [Campylobacter sp. RM16192]|uniref:cytochrome-c peroxidase n=1 Tax=Campylobacter sp. RM16192 TaxID=1660080 RepID=UPI001F0039C8|nr:cytochrome c peroxidase [Campylobacter sp. RM16192]